MKLVIVGSGVMAESMAKFFISSSFFKEIIIITRNDSKHLPLRKKIDSYLDSLQRKGKIKNDELSAFKSKLFLSDDYKYILGAKIIIEAISEDVKIKAKTFSLMSKYIDKKTIVATNSSSLSITQLSSFLPYRERFLGIHFFNPVTVMELVEIVVGHLTDKTLVSEVKKMMVEVGKTPIIVNESPGFVVNRMLIPMLNEAVGIYAEKIASIEDIDKAMKLGVNHPMGPLSLSDLIGNDITLSIMDVLHSETGDPKYRAHPLLRKMVRSNHLGRKTKKGFYEY